MAREELPGAADREARVGAAVAREAGEQHADPPIRDFGRHIGAEGKLEHARAQGLLVAPQHGVGRREDLRHPLRQELRGFGAAAVLEQPAVHGAERRAHLRDGGRKGRQGGVERAPEGGACEQAEEHLHALVVDEGVDQDL